MIAVAMSVLEVVDVVKMEMVRVMESEEVDVMETEMAVVMMEMVVVVVSEEPLGYLNMPLPSTPREPFPSSPSSFPSSPSFPLWLRWRPRSIRVSRGSSSLQPPSDLCNQCRLRLSLALRTEGLAVHFSSCSCYIFV